MFENISQGIFNIGATGYLVVVPILRFIAILLLAASTYKLLKVRQDKHKLLWIAAIFISPIIARIAYEIYRRFIDKKETGTVKGSTSLMLASVVVFFVSSVLMAVSVASVGIGFIKSEIDGEPLAAFYDVNGNEYDNLYDVPLYDKEGNRYTYEAELFTAGTYTDQNGKSYDGDYCYLSEDGYFYFDENNELKPIKDSYDYYTDGETVYYIMFSHVYWAEDGTIYEFTGKMHLELFDFDE